MKALRASQNRKVVAGLINELKLFLKLHKVEKTQLIETFHTLFSQQEASRQTEAAADWSETSSQTSSDCGRSGFSGQVCVCAGVTLKTAKSSAGSYLFVCKQAA